MSNKMTLKVSKTEITEFEIDLDDWYSYGEMSPKEQHVHIQNLLNEYEEIVKDGGYKTISKENDSDLLEWDLKK